MAFPAFESAKFQLIMLSICTFTVTSSPLEVRRHIGIIKRLRFHVLQMDWAIDALCFFSMNELHPPLISTPLRFSPSRDTSIITDACGLALRLLYLCVWLEVGIQIWLFIRKNHIGSTWMPPSLSSSWSNLIHLHTYLVYLTKFHSLSRKYTLLIWRICSFDSPESKQIGDRILQSIKFLN